MLYFAAPKLKGRPRRKRKKRSVSPGESSNESEASVASTSRGGSSSSHNLVVPSNRRSCSAGVRRSERKVSAEERRFIDDVSIFMSDRGTPVGKMPLLGYKQSKCDQDFGKNVGITIVILYIN